MPLLGYVAPYHQAVKIIEDLGLMGVFSLLISGGEPTLHPRFLDLMRVAYRAIPITAINTNGIRHSRIGFARAFHTIAPNSLVSISLDSPNAEVNDQARGAGGTAAIRAIENCVAVGQTVCISAVLTESSAKTSAQLIERFAPNVRKFRFFPRVPRNADDLRANDDGYVETIQNFYQIVEDIRRSDPSLDIIVPKKPSKELRDGSREDLKSGCLCPQTKLYIDSQLRAYPCYYSASKETCMGSCAEQSLAELWASKRAREIRTAGTMTRLCGVQFGKQAIPNRYRDTPARQGDQADGPAAGGPAA